MCNQQADPSIVASSYVAFPTEVLLEYCSAGSHAEAAFSFATLDNITLISSAVDSHEDF